ncbi:MAG: hypothetical protein ACXWL5_03935 [Candidatus Chromulinivorax sp.]
MSKKLFLFSLIIFNSFINFNLKSMWSSFYSQEKSDGQDVDYQVKLRERLYNQHKKKWNAINKEEFAQDVNFENVSKDYDKPAEDWFIDNWINSDKILEKNDLESNYQKNKRDADYNYLLAQDLASPKIYKLVSIIGMIKQEYQVFYQL